MCMVLFAVVLINFFSLNLLKQKPQQTLLNQKSYFLKTDIPYLLPCFCVVLGLTRLCCYFSGVLEMYGKWRLSLGWT